MPLSPRSKTTGYLLLQTPFFLHGTAAASQPWTMGGCSCPSLQGYRDGPTCRAFRWGSGRVPRAPGSLRADKDPSPSWRLSPREAISPRKDYVSQRLPAGLHMLRAAPGTLRQLPVRCPVRRRDVRCRPRCGSRCDGRRGADPGAALGDSLGRSRRGSQCSSRRRPLWDILPVRPRERTAEPRRRPGPERSRAPPPRPGSMPRGRAWTQAEVSKLLSLVRDSGEAALLMASTSRPNEALWREISQDLAAHGYGRSVAQCRSKWKALKQAFHSERETRQKAGHPSSRLPPHYRAMKIIWKAAGQPVFGERRMTGGCWGRACR